MSSLALGAGLLMGLAAVPSQAAPVPDVPFSVVNEPQDPPVPPTSPSPEESPGEDKGELDVAGVDRYLSSPRNCAALLRSCVSGKTSTRVWTCPTCRMWRSITCRRVCLGSRR
ncbi:MAG: hypothetical protein U1U88_001518 [Lawsonella clevelandensis]